MNLSERLARRFPSTGGGATPAVSPAVRRSSSCGGRESSAVASCAKGGEEASVAGRKKGLPCSPIYRGGVVTGAVTTLSGSQAVQNPVALCVCV